MKLIKCFSVLCMVVLGTVSSAQNPYTGIWKTIDDNTGVVKSHVEIYEQDGGLYGKVVGIMDETQVNEVCGKCNGEKKDQPILGMVILEGLERKGDYYGGGRITDPENGKSYKCYIELKGDGKLKVRGYIGTSAFGRTQYWCRVE